MEQAAAIGLFDSGIGGLTVLQEVLRQLPAEDTVYFADTAHVPYGSRRGEELVTFADGIVRFLISHRVKVIIFACNTSSSVSLEIIKKRYSVPMVGMIEPAARLVAATVKGPVGVMATEATVKSGAYQQALQLAAPGLEVRAVACPRFVPLVEKGQEKSAAAREAAAAYLEPLLTAGVDSLLLGCTHYPLLQETLQAVAGPGVKIIDPARAVVEEVKNLLLTRGLLRSEGLPRHYFYASGDPSAFAQAGRRVIGSVLEQVTHVQPR